LFELRSRQIAAMDDRPRALPVGAGAHPLRPLQPARCASPAQRRKFRDAIGLADDLADISQMPVEAALKPTDQRI